MLRKLFPKVGYHDFIRGHTSSVVSLCLQSNTCRLKKINRIESVNPGLRQTAVDTQSNEGRQGLRFRKHEPAPRENDSHSSARGQKNMSFKISHHDSGIRWHMLLNKVSKVAVSKPIAPKVQSRTSSRNTTCLSCSNGSLTMLQKFSKAPFTSFGVNKCLCFTMNRASCEKQASISSCVWPLLRNWHVIACTRREETREQQKRMPPLFFHSPGVLSYCTVMLVWGRHWPCFSRIVKACEMISQVALESFLVPGREMMNKANLPWQITRLTLSFTL